MKPITTLAPNWSLPATADLTCPLCNYNLRGLTEPRCPECGFAFQWAELLDAKRDRHPYLFEHGAGHNVRTFWTTYWRTCRPRRFWREVTPANTVRVGRLIAYWAIASLLLIGIFLAPLPGEGAQLARMNQLSRALRTPIYSQSMVPGRIHYPPGAATMAPQLSALYPTPASPKFYAELWETHWDNTDVTAFGMAAVVAVWPWLTLAALMVFQASMRRAKVNIGHVLRAAVYGSDFGLLLVVCSATLYLRSDPSQGFRLNPGPLSEQAAALMGVVALACAIVGSYRLTFAYSRYLRFHLPLATVLSAQALVWLFVVAALFRVCYP